MSITKPRVSIIIRTKNEERWIGSCLGAISRQTYKDYEVVIVDNESTDKTLVKAVGFGVSKFQEISNYVPGKALNQGIEASEGELIVCLSAHCIPKDNAWLETLVQAIDEDTSFAGVYGRQEPMSFSSPSDKRDLHLVFGLDRKYQRKDSFFHNANSIIRRDCWEMSKFDDAITNIEDRLWAQKMLDFGFSLLYEPEASVYHFHGIHQDRETNREENVVNIINKYDQSASFDRVHTQDIFVVALIPIKDVSAQFLGKTQLEWALESIQSSKFIKKILVSTGNEDTQSLAIRLGADAPFLRPEYLSEDYVNLEAVQQYSLEILEKAGSFPDLIVHIEETIPFRPPSLIDEMIEMHLRFNFDSVVCGRQENGFLWQERKSGEFDRLDSGDVPRKYKEKTYVGTQGAGVITTPGLIREQRIIGGRVGVFRSDDFFLHFEVRTEQDRVTIKSLAQDYFGGMLTDR